MKDSFIEIIPSLLGFTFAIIPLIYFIFVKNSKGIIIASFTFLFSGFSIQIVIKYGEIIRIFANKYHNIFSFPLVTVIGTAIGIFAGNKMLRFFLDGKERKEISILLTSAINAQVINLGFIDLYAKYNPTQDDISHIEIYQSEFDNDEPFTVAFNRIGIYKESDIKLITDYYIQLKQCLNYIKRFLLKNKGRNNQGSSSIFTIVKTSLASTKITGILCVYNFSVNYCNQNKEKLRDDFLNDCHKIIEKFRGDLIDFGNSEEEAKEQCKKLVKDTLQSRLSNQEIDDWIQKQLF